MTKPDTRFDFLPRRFPAWPGLSLAALAVGGACYLWFSGALPPALWTSGGKLLLVAHTLTVYALVTLLGEKLRFRGWLSVLARTDRSSPRDDAENWVLRGLKQVFSQLPPGATRGDLKAAISATQDVFQKDLSRRWAAFLVLCFAIPLFGGLLSLWNLRVEANSVPFREVGLPLIIAVIEALAVLMLVTSLTRDARFALDRWALTAEAIALGGGPKATASKPSRNESAETAPDGDPDTEAEERARRADAARARELREAIIKEAARAKEQQAQAEANAAAEARRKETARARELAEAEANAAAEARRREAARARELAEAQERESAAAREREKERERESVKERDAEVKVDPVTPKKPKPYDPVEYYQ